MTAKTKKAYAPKTGSTSLVIIEDLNMPEPDRYRQVAALDMLRSLLRDSSYMDYLVGDRVDFEGLQFVAAYDPSIRPISTGQARLRRHFFLASVPEFEEQDCKTQLFQ